LIEAAGTSLLPLRPRLQGAGSTAWTSIRSRRPSPDSRRCCRRALHP
jgi:hypothetical protein